MDSRAMEEMVDLGHRVPPGSQEVSLDALQVGEEWIAVGLDEHPGAFSGRIRRPVCLESLGSRFGLDWVVSSILDLRLMVRRSAFDDRIYRGQAAEH